MTTLVKASHLQNAQPPKAVSQIKSAAKPQPSGLSREELRQIVLEILG